MSKQSGLKIALLLLLFYAGFCYYSFTKKTGNSHSKVYQNVKILLDFYHFFCHK